MTPPRAQSSTPRDRRGRRRCVLLLAGTFAARRAGTSRRKTVTAHFPRAVSVYEGTDVRILGVNVGKVTAVIPEGNSVRVEMEYDAKYDVPAGRQGGDRHPDPGRRPLRPAHARRSRRATGDGGRCRHPAARHRRAGRAGPHLRQPRGPHRRARAPTGSTRTAPSTTPWPRPAKAFEGNGALGNQMIRNLSEAAVTFGEGSGDLFDTVSSLARFTEVLAANDAVVRAFMKDLAGGLGRAGRRARGAHRRARRRSPTPWGPSRRSSGTTARRWSPTSRS